MVERLALLPGRRARREIVERRLPPLPRASRKPRPTPRSQSTESHLAKHALERVKIERELQCEELELEADRIKGHADLAGMRAEADTRMAALEAARLNPELSAGDTVRGRRKELGLSQIGLAGRAGVSVKRISDLEAGRGGPDHDLRCIARVLDLEVSAGAIPSSRPGAARSADEGRRVIECPDCHRVSHHPVDVQTGWCSECSRFTGKTADEVRAAAAECDNPLVAASILWRLDKFGARSPTSHGPGEPDRRFILGRQWFGVNFGEKYVSLRGPRYRPLFSERLRKGCRVVPLGFGWRIVIRARGGPRGA